MDKNVLTSNIHTLYTVYKDIHSKHSDHIICTPKQQFISMEDVKEQLITANT